ncbi:PTS mannitol transporter subunit IICBA [Buchnera aphidicola]|uniref:PTS mannitol transporter subunit IICBA n=1 Tax=Buchnera aphidicola TaxID=9 RepID=UPI003464307E
MFKLITLKIQIFGRFLSNMIMPNISVFIAWGVMTSLFLPLGWFPNSSLSHLISPIMTYLLPLSISYTGGRLIAGDRGGLAGSIGVIGAITSTNMPMLLGAMIVGPLSGWSVKYFDKLIENKIKNGFEMLVNNFSLAIISIIISILSFFFVGPFIEFIAHFLSLAIKIFTDYHFLPIISIIIEPAKIFFLNNAINHGVLSPLGIQEVIEKNSSIFFLIESNPGPGLGILMAWFFYGKGDLSKTAGGAAFIEFLGGVHEIYFPYVLIKPKLIIALILGGVTGVFSLVTLQGGLISAVSPGSILSILAMTPKGLYLVNIISIFCSFLVSYISSVILLQIQFNKNKNLNTSCSSHINIKKYIDHNSFENILCKNIKKIIVACDAGMGSSALGASILRKKIYEANLTYISVSNTAINLLPKTADLIITHYHLTQRAKIYAPDAQHLSLKNFLNHDFYDSLIQILLKNKPIFNNADNTDNILDLVKPKFLFTISKKNIFLNQYANNKEEAITLVGRYLFEQGYVQENYINAMLEREKISSTWIGESIALPHGTIQSKDSILKTGIIFCQFPQGVHFGDEIDDVAYIVIGIAARNNEHITVVSKITNALDNAKIIKQLSKTQNIEEVLSYLTL